MCNSKRRVRLSKRLLGPNCGVALAGTGGGRSGGSRQQCRLYPRSVDPVPALAVLAVSMGGEEQGKLQSAASAVSAALATAAEAPAGDFLAGSVACRCKRRLGQQGQRSPPAAAV